MPRDHSIRQLWEDLAFPHLIQSVSLAVGPIKVILAFLAVLLICSFGYVLDLVSHSVAVNPQPQVRTEGGNNPGLETFPNELAVYIQDPSRTRTFIEQYRSQDPGQGVFGTLWNYMASRFNNATTRLLHLDGSAFFANLWNVFVNMGLCIRSLFWAVRFHPWYSVLFLTFSTCVLCFLGGAICRCAALEFARNEKPGLMEAFQFSREHFKNLLTAPLMPLGLVILLGAVVILFGWFGNVPWAGELVIALGFLFLLALGLLMAMLLFATAAGATLLFPAVAYEGTTGLDAIGRSFSYVLNQPLWMIFYTFVEAILGALFYLFIRLFVFLVLRLTYVLLNLGFPASGDGPGKLERIWAEPTFFQVLRPPAGPANWSESAASFLISLCLLLIVGLVMALVFSYLFSSITVLYSLMRKKVDQVDYHQVDVHLSEIQDLRTK